MTSSHLTDVAKVRVGGMKVINRYVGRASMNKARDAVSAGYATNPPQIHVLLVKLLQHSVDVARSPGERTLRTSRHDALHMCIPPGEGEAATEAFEVLRQDGILWWGR